MTTTGPKTVIALTGHKGSGKTLAADIITRELPEFYKTAFAEPLKEACSIIFGLSPAEMSDRDLKELPLERYPFQSPREILQKVGTEAIRAHWPTAWVEALLHRIRPFPDVVIHDLRYANEAAAIREMGGKIIRIERPSLASEPPDLHPSETVQDSIEADKTVLNDGSQGLFAARVLAAVMELREGK